MTVTTYSDRVVRRPGPAGGSGRLDLDGPAARTLFVGREPGLGEATGTSDVGVEGDVTLLDRGPRVGEREDRTGRRRPPAHRLPERRTGSRAATACVDTAGPTLHGSRLTRRGRLLVGLAWLALVAIAAVAVMRAVSPEPAGAPAVETVTVDRGDTVWDIARAADPVGDAREVVSAIVELNGLESVGDIHAGDRLVVPAAP